MDFTFDWIWLGIQIAILLAVAGGALRAKGGSDLVGFLVACTLLVFFQCQGAWLFRQLSLDQAAGMYVQYDYFTAENLRAANIYIGISTILFAATYFFVPVRKQISVPSRASVARLRISYIIPIGIILAAGFSLIESAGGLEASFTRPGQNLAGGTLMLLLLAGMAKYPLFQRSATGFPGTKLDWLLFSALIALCALNSRYVAALFLAQVILVRHYAGSRVTALQMMIFGLGIFLLFIVFGLYREYTARIGYLEFAVLVEFLRDYSDLELPLRWFFTGNIEAFSGVAGILTASDANEIRHDWGISNLRVLFQFVPFSIREASELPFREWNEYFISLYPRELVRAPGTDEGAAQIYSGLVGTVVPSGMENFYAHFGAIGFPAFGIALGVLTRWADARLRDPFGDRVMIAIIAVNILQAIRGPLWTTVAFVIAECLLLYLYRVALQIRLLEARRPSRSTAGGGQSP
jgi:hypothetical protein